MEPHYPLFYVFHFYLFGAIALASAIAFVTRKSPVAAALWLVNTMFSLAALFVMLDAQFIGVMQVLVYAGAIMLKMGTFGFLRFALPLFPGAAMNPTVRMIILILAVIGILYGALVAMVQPDFKKLVAYSSVSHLGFVMLGIFALTLGALALSTLVTRAWEEDSILRSTGAG